VSSIHFVILAAGLGSRLAKSGYDKPKWLLDVGGSPIADRQLRGIRRATGDASSTITVVAGHRANLVDQYAGSTDLPVKVVVNAEFDTRNNWYSLLLGVNSLELDSDDRVVVINSDLCAKADWFAAVIDGVLELGSDVLAIDADRPLTQEAMKVVASTTNGVRVLEEIGKSGLEGEPIGEYVGLLSMSSTGVKLLRQELERFAQDSARADEWYEAAIGLSATSIDWILHPVPNSEWTEVDDPTDLITAEAQL
jgi:choline kinase